MINLVKILFPIFLFLNTLVADASVFGDFSVIENTNSKTEYISSKQNQTAIEISKKQDTFFIKNEENQQITTLNNKKNNSANSSNQFYLNNFFSDNIFYSIDINPTFKTSYYATSRLKHSIQKRAP